MEGYLEIKLGIKAICENCRTYCTTYGAMVNWLNCKMIQGLVFDHNFSLKFQLLLQRT